MDDSIDAVEDLVQSVFAEDSHDIYDEAPRITKASKYADSFFYNARQLADRYKGLRRSGLSGVQYPDFVPPFLAHMAICTLAMSDKSVNAAGNSVYPRVAKFLVDRIQVRKSQETEAKDVEKVKKALMKDYAYGGTGTFARTSYRIDTQGAPKIKTYGSMLRLGARTGEMQRLGEERQREGPFVQFLRLLVGNTETTLSTP